MFRKIRDTGANTRKRLSDAESAIESLGEGGPAGIYATVAALEVAFPTGDTRIYIVTADNNWYYWSGSAWTSGGVYADALLIDDASTAADRVLSASYIKGQLSAIDTQLAEKANKIETSWITPTLINGATHQVNNPVRYRKNQFGMVEFKGAFSNVSAQFVAAFVLNAGHRPLVTMFFSVGRTATASGIIYIQTGGEVVVGSGTVTDNFQLSQIKYEAV